MTIESRDVALNEFQFRCNACCWPIEIKEFVREYRTQPAGRFAKINPKTRGITSIAFFCAGSIFDGVNHC